MCWNFGAGGKSGYSESGLEIRIIENLQAFLLALGAGYTFVFIQKRFIFNEQHFQVDLVFYNCIPRCFVVFDL